MSFFPDTLGESSLKDVPWLMLALRSCSILTNLVQEFVLHFCSMLAKAIECELWLYKTSRIGVDILVKLAKLIAFKASDSRGFVRIFTGIGIDVGDEAHLISVPVPVVQESGRDYERQGAIWAKWSSYI